MSEPPHNSPFSDHPVHSSDLLSAGDIALVLRRRGWIGILAGIVVAGGIFVGIMQQTPRYEASSSLVVELNPDRVINVEEVVDIGVERGLLSAAMNTHLERLRSRRMAETVLNELSSSQRERIRRPFLNPNLPREDQISVTPGMIRDIIEISWLRNSQVLQITARHPDPEVTQMLSSLYATHYIGFQTSLRDTSTSSAVSFLEREVNDIHQRLDAKERELAEYRRTHNLVAVEDNRSVISDELRQINNALTEQRIKAIELRTLLAQIEEAHDDLDRLLEISPIARPASIQEQVSRLNEVENERDELAETFLARHPMMLTTAARRDSLEASLRRSIERRIAEIRGDYSAVQASLSGLESELKEAESRSLELDRLAIEFNALRREVDSERRTYEQLALRLNETSIASQIDITNLRILDIADTPRDPYSPSLLLASLLGAALFGVVFVGLPLAIELIDKRLQTYADIENYIGKPILGDVRFLPGKSSSQIMTGVMVEDEALLESFRGIYSNLLLCRLPESSLALVVTSSIPEEGKTSIAGNLAEVFGRHGKKTLLIDADLRRPSLHRGFDLKNDQGGLVSWIQGEEDLPPVGVSLEEFAPLALVELAPQTWLLRSGGSTKSPTEIFSNPRFDRIISRIKTEFDVIVLDTPPVGVFPDATLIGEYTDGTVFVARQRKVSKAKARNSVIRMDRSGSPVLGVVFNAVRGRSAAGGEGYADSYQYGYDKYTEKYQKEYTNSGS